MPEAQLKDSGSGLAPATDGWFVVNVRGAEWWFAERRGARVQLRERVRRARRSSLTAAINITALEAGQTTLYHRESSQEAFLVLSGECRLLVEGEERLLRPWDFLRLPPGTEHTFVGAGEGPCLILMAGARAGAQSEEGQVRYPASELAAGYGASVREEHPPIRRRPTRRPSGSAEERPSYWDRLPWA